ncbi:glutathione S-transferase family protein [Spirulina sp. CS-785/01]|uniref:glutathione S-transferase family protein n=1 Tax=Spirulina sp. CS-785/01 TaxID=3021716 RepID=UPI00232B5A5A|nr:glutathione S-transferase family protein [Spirulina sp. CS-785/01]MDB9312463.1 glutathione S-transferase family protein [Spirulina sp. CS-785/01]
MSQLTLVIGNKNYSSWSLRSWLAMKQARLDFQEVRILLDTHKTHQEIRQYSPSGRVPVLLHDKMRIWESLAICEYVAETLAPQLWPSDPNAKAVARSVSAEMHAGFADLRRSMPMDCRSRFPGMGMNPSVQADINRIIEIWRHCRQTFGQGGDFLFGDFSIADAMFAPVISRFVTYDVPLDPISGAYARAVWELPAMQDWLYEASQEVEVIPSFFYAT